MDESGVSCADTENGFNYAKAGVYVYIMITVGIKIQMSTRVITIERLCNLEISHHHALAIDHAVQTISVHETRYHERNV